MRRQVFNALMLTVALAAALVSAASAEILLWEPFDYTVGQPLPRVGGTPAGPWWYWADGVENGFIANDIVLDSGSYLKNTGPFPQDSWEQTFAKATIAANEVVELTAVVRRQPGNTAPELYIYSGNETATMRYCFSPQDASWGGGNWFVGAINLDATTNYEHSTTPIAGANDVVDMKIAVARNDVSFLWRNHGSADWNLVSRIPGYGTDSVEKVQIALYSETTAADAMDSVKVERKVVVPAPEVLLWEPFDYQTGMALGVGSGGSWAWQGDSSGDNGIISNDVVLDAGNYLKNTGPALDGEIYDRSFAQTTIGANEKVEFSTVVRRQAGNTAPEIYIFSGNAANTIRYNFSPQDAWGGNWFMQALNLDTFNPELPSTFQNMIVPITGAGDVVDMKIVVKTTDVSFYWRNHGNVSWIPLTIMPGFGTDSVEKVTIALYSEILSADGLDSVKVVKSPLTANAGILAGQVMLENYMGGALPAVTIQFIKSGTVVKTADVILDQSGNYSVEDVPADTYDLRFKAASWLAQKVTGQEVNSGGIKTCNVTLLGGDVDGNNAVAESDLGVVLANIDQSGD